MKKELVTKVKTEYVICDKCGRAFKPKYLLAVQTGVDTQYFCIECLTEAYHQLERMKHRDPATEELFLGIKKFLKKRNIKPWLRTN